MNAIIQWMMATYFELLSLACVKMGHIQKLDCGLWTLDCTMDWIMDRLCTEELSIKAGPTW